MMSNDPTPAPSPGSGWLTIQANPASGSWPSAREAESFPPAFGEWWYREAKAQRTAREQAERERPVCRECNDHFDAASLCEHCVETRDAIAQEKLAAVESRLAEVTAIADGLASLVNWTDAEYADNGGKAVADALRARLAKAKGEG